MTGRRTSAPRHCTSWAHVGSGLHDPELLALEHPLDIERLAVAEQRGDRADLGAEALRAILAEDHALAGRDRDLANAAVGVEPEHHRIVGPRDDLGAVVARVEDD